MGVEQWVERHPEATNRAVTGMLCAAMLTAGAMTASKIVSLAELNGLQGVTAEVRPPAPEPTVDAAVPAKDTSPHGSRALVLLYYPILRRHDV